jgi:undecaprenyl-diphosphatase
MIEILTELDQKTFLLLNSLAFPALDPVMLALSSHWLWVPVYISLAAWFIWKYRVKGLIPLGLLFLAILLTDQASVHLFKEVFERLRPCHEPGIMEKTRLVAASCGGPFGFVSSHAANSFGLATVSDGLIKKRWYNRTIFTWAILVSYSRIYVGVHYPGDVIGGMILGSIIGGIIIFIYNRTIKKYTENAQTQEA